MVLAVASYTPTQPTTVTMTSANPGVVSFGAHGLLPNQAIIFNTTGALPTNIVALTIYYVLSAGYTTGTFRVGATPGGAAIDMTSGAQSGVHSCVPIINNLIAGQQVMASSAGMVLPSDQTWPKAAPVPGTLPTALADSQIFSASACGLISIQVTVVASTGGWLLILNATSKPGNGAVTPIWKVPIDTNGVRGYYEHSWGSSPLTCTTGCVPVFSTTGPYSLTASAVADFTGQIQA